MVGEPADRQQPDGTLALPDRARALHGPGSVPGHGDLAMTDPSGVSPEVIEEIKAMQANDPPKPKPGQEPMPTLTTEEILRQMMVEARRGDESVVPTGWYKIDTAMGKLMRPPWLSVIAARTGIGKTWIVQHLAEQAVMNDPGHRVLFLPLEMSPHEMGERVSAHALGESPHDVYRRAYNGDDLAGQVMMARPQLERIRWYDRGCSIEELPRIYEGAALDFHAPPTVMVVDYLGLLRWQGRKGATQYERASENAWRIKDFAKEYNVLVLAAVQLSRAGGRAGDVEPSLDSLRDSGATEEASDLVLMFWRTAAEEGEPQRMGDATEINCKVAKNRHGGYDSTILGYDHALRLTERDEYDLTPY